MSTTDRMTTEQTPETAVLQALKQITEASNGRTVFAEPVTQGEVTIVPAAQISGGGGSGGSQPGKGEEGRPGMREGRQGKGLGAGMGLSAKPAGAFVIKGGKVDWRPALDVNKVILGGQIVAIAALVTIRTLIRARAVQQIGRRRRMLGMREVRQARRGVRQMRRARRQMTRMRRGAVLAKRMQQRGWQRSS